VLSETIKEIQLLNLEKKKKKKGFQPKIISDLNVSKETHGIGWADWAPNFIGKCNFLMAFPYCAAQRNIRLIKILMSHFQKCSQRIMEPLGSFLLRTLRYPDACDSEAERAFRVRGRRMLCPARGDLIFTFLNLHIWNIMQQI